MSINFPLLLVIAVAVCGALALFDLIFLAPRRRAAISTYHGQVSEPDEAVVERLNKEPLLVEYGKSFFPVLAIVLVLRSFLVEPFQIPSGSMKPTLEVGDFILVNKFAYGIRLPVLDTKVIEVGDPQRGDVMVFRYPPQPSLDYIKRVVGVPGDEVAYLNKQLSINGQPVPRSQEPEFFDSDVMRYAKQFGESLGGRNYKTLNDEDRPAFVSGTTEFAYKDNCRYSVEGVVCKVPDGHYFMMGDNRDNSLDSRYWGFVPEANIVGKAFFVWMNFGDLGRIGSFE